MSDWVRLGPALVAIGAFFTVVSVGALVAVLVMHREPRPQGLSITRPPERERPKGLEGLAHALAAPHDPQERSLLRLSLVQAGYEGQYALEQMIALRAALALLLPTLAWLAWQPGRLVVVLSLVLVLSSLGYYAPALVIYQQRRARQETLARGFANALDMLISCLEAGLGIDAALVHVARELRFASPELAKALEQVNVELRAGVPRNEALHHLADRSGLPEVRSLVNVLAQAERYGTGIAQSIRAHTHMLRMRRALEAERRAAQATPKLTVAMIVFILPALFVVLLGPSVVNISERLLPTLLGGQP